MISLWEGKIYVHFIIRWFHLWDRIVVRLRTLYFFFTLLMRSDCGMILHILYFFSTPLMNQIVIKIYVHFTFFYSTYKIRLYMFFCCCIDGYFWVFFFHFMEILWHDYSFFISSISRAKKLLSKNCQLNNLKWNLYIDDDHEIEEEILQPK